MKIKQRLMKRRLTKKRRRFPELSYESPNDPRLKRWVIRTIEGLSGRDKYLDLYEKWQELYVGRSDRIMSDLLQLLNVKISRHGSSWPPADIPDGPLVLVANHPFGIGDGMAALSLAEDLGRPFRVLINKELIKVPEIRPYSLPVDFDETREALHTNLKTKKEALRLLAEGVTIVVFPAGGVATAERPFGKAEDLPWKLFPARLIQSAKANVLPVYFSGQNGPLFHLASKFSMTLRLSLLVREFKKFTKSDVHVYIGGILPFADIAHLSDRRELTDHLYETVFSLAPDEEKLAA